MPSVKENSEKDEAYRRASQRPSSQLTLIEEKLDESEQTKYRPVIKNKQDNDLGMWDATKGGFIGGGVIGFIISVIVVASIGAMSGGAGWVALGTLGAAVLGVGVGIKMSLDSDLPSAASKSPDHLLSVSSASSARDRTPSIELVKPKQTAAVNKDQSSSLNQSTPEKSASVSKTPAHTDGTSPAP